jgi:hypothetical protein
LASVSASVKPGVALLLKLKLPGSALNDRVHRPIQTVALTLVANNTNGSSTSTKAIGR